MGRGGERLHDLRHTAAPLAGAAGESVLFMQSMLGHSDVRTTGTPIRITKPSRSGCSRGCIQERRHH
jgi:integrase